MITGKSVHKMENNFTSKHIGLLHKLKRRVASGKPGLRNDWKMKNTQRACFISITPFLGSADHRTQK